MRSVCAPRSASQDRIRLDEYLSLMRSLEERVQRRAAAPQKTWKPRVPIDPKARPPDRPTITPSTYV